MAQEEVKKKDEVGFWMKVGLCFVWLGNMVGQTIWIFMKSFGLAVARSWNRFWKWFWPLMPKGKPKFASLAPTENAQHIQIYSEALSQALLDKNVLNIAIAGTFGSGKSSFLRTYFKEHPSFWPFGCKKNKVITVSLADLVTNEKPRGKGDENPLTRQEIELSILHQFFFHKRAGSLADSHYTKIQKFDAFKLCIYTLGVMAYILSIVHLVKPKWLTITFELQKLGISAYREWWHWACVIIAVMGTAWMLARLIRVVAQLAVRKLSVNSASIEITNKCEKSILNEHIDEIIYFFSVTGYNVVILEDLDRFKQQSIFVKLREINYLINNSEEVKQRVRFIYALSDDMFTNEERTKFFDFIIPIIPQVDVSNAGDMLHTLVPENIGKLVDVVAVYLHDARMLNNIVNEFNVYKYKQENPNPKDDEQIFAMVVYKNLYPADFEDLRTQRKGLLAYALHQRKELINALTAKKDESIAKIEADMAAAHQEQLRDIKELRQLIISSVLQGAIDNSTNGYICRQINCGDETFNIAELVKDDKFEKFRKAKSYTYQGGYNYRSAGVPFAILAQTVYGDESYEERLRKIQLKIDDTDAKEQEQRLNEEKVQLKAQTIQQLLQSKLLKINWGEYEENVGTKVQREFIYDMLYGGYITENYADYISFFHEGSMSKEDYQFIRGVRIKEQSLEPEVQLYNVEKVIERLDLGNFSQVEVLNFSLVDALVTNNLDSDKCANVIKRLKKYDSHSIVFIAAYVAEGRKSGILINKLCADKDKLFWNAIEKSNLSDEAKKRIIQSIIENGEETDVLRNLNNSEAYLSGQSDYFKWPIPEKRLKKIAQELDLQFDALADDTSSDYVQFVYDKCLYVITPEMLERVIPKSQWNEAAFRKANYSYLHDAGLSVMLNYVNSKVDVYVTNVLLKVAPTMEDEPRHVSELLGNDLLTKDDKEAIVQHESKEWDAVDAYDDNIKEEDKLLLFTHKRVQVSWENVMRLYELDAPTFVTYMKDVRVAKVLQRIGRPEFGAEEQKTWGQMQNTLVAIDETAEVLIDCFDIEFEQPALIHCSSDVIRRLIENEMIAIGINEYNEIHGTDRDLGLEFFVAHYVKFQESISKMDFDQYDVSDLFGEKYDLEIEQRLQILDNINAKRAITEENSNSLINFLMKPDVPSENISDGLRNVIEILLFMEEEPTLGRVALFNKFRIYTVADDLDRFIETFDSRFVENGHLKNHLPFSAEMLTFGRYLKQKGYLTECKSYLRTKGYITVVRNKV